MDTLQIPDIKELDNETQKRIYEHEGRILREKINRVRVGKKKLTFYLSDGRTISAPINWYPFLDKASPPHRNNYKIAGGGWSVWWPDLDDGLNSRHLLKGKAPDC